MQNTFDKEACGLHTPIPLTWQWVQIYGNDIIFINNKGRHSTVLAQYSDQYIRPSPLSAQITLPKINISVFGST